MLLVCLIGIVTSVIVSFSCGRVFLCYFTYAFLKHSLINVLNNHCLRAKHGAEGLVYSSVLQLIKITLATETKIHSLVCAVA